MRFGTILLASAIALSATAAYAMTAETFYVKGSALKQKGIGALFSSDLKLLQKEMGIASKSVRSENETAKVAGHPIYCPPGKGKMSAEQVLAEFGKIPQAHRQEVTVRQAWKEILIKKYPC
jgi:hypothetical protein